MNALNLVSEGRDARNGLDLFGVEGPGEHRFRVSGRHGGPAVIRTATGLAYVAGEFVAMIRGDQIGHLTGEHRALRYGPGGRRIYFLVTEQLCDDLYASAAHPPRNAKESELRDLDAAFAVALSELI